MADVNANINIGIDTSNAAAQLKALETQLSEFNNRVISSNQRALAAQRQALSLLQTKIGDTGGFSTEIRNVESSVSRFSKSLEKGKLSFGEYWRYGLASTKKFGSAFDKELATIDGLAEDRVKRLSTRYVSLGKDINGMHKALAIRPNQLAGGMETQIAMAAQKQQIFNQLLKQGSTQMVNWGKNTQWAGRQLMVGFTIPLTIFGGVAMKVFADLEKQTIAFQRVYGDLSTSVTETDAMTESVKGLAKEFTKWGMSVSDTMGMAARAAATGATGDALISQTTQATRLATLGQMEQEEALKATISMQNAFKMSNQEVAESVNFLNAVENQTVVSLQDIAGAIPRVAPVIQGLGGDVKDLSVFLAAMQEGGVGAAEGANALKSGLASLINPTKQAQEGLAAVGIDIQAIIDTNRGDLMGTVTGFANALKDLDNTTKQQILAKVFGKYQFARLGALFENITTEGSQAARVMDLAGMSIQDLASLSEKELGKIEDAVSVKFQASIEKLKVAIAPIGELFMKVATPIIEGATKIFDVFNSMPDQVKTAIFAVVTILGTIAPVFLMGVGLVANGIGNLLKGFGLLRTMYQKMVGSVSGGTTPLTQAFGFLTMAELDAIAAGEGLESALMGTTGTLLIQKGAVDGLTASYKSLVSTMAGVAATNPQGFTPVRSPRIPRKMARGGSVGGRGNKDSEPALLMPGEFVVTKEAAEQYAPILVAMNQGRLKGRALGGPVGGATTPEGRSFVPRVGSSEIPQSSRSLYEFGHSAGFASSELKKTVTELSATAEGIRALGDRASEADRVFLELLDSVLSAEKTFVKFEQAADGSWHATETATKALSDLAIQAESSASLGQFGGGRITSGTRNQALANIGVDEPISFVDLNFAAQKAELALTSVANGTKEMGAPFQYALQGIIDEANMLRGDMKAQGKYLLDNAQSMIRDGLMTDKKMSAEEALTQSLRERQAIEAKLISSGAMLNGEIIDSTRAQQVVEAYLLKQAKALAISTNAQVAKRASMSATSSADAGRIVQPREDSGKIFGGSETRKAVAQKLKAEGVEIGKEMGVYLGPAIGEGFSQGLDVSSPPPWSIQLGMWIREGIESGAMKQSQYPEALPSKMPTTLAVDPQIAKNLEAMGMSAGRSAIATDKDAIAKNIDATATLNEATAHAVNEKAITQETRQRRRGIGGFGKMLFAVDGVTMAASFLPGKLGEFANKLLMASLALTSLVTVLQVELVNKALKAFGTKLLSLAGGSIAKAGVGSAIKAGKMGVVDAALGVSAATDVAGFIKARKAQQQLGDAAIKSAGMLGKFGKIAGVIGKFMLPVTATFGAIAKLGGSIGKLVIAVGRFIGIIGKAAGLIPGLGWAIAAVTTALSVGFVISDYKNLGDKTRDLGNAAVFASDKLKTIGETFGFEPRTSGFQQRTTGLGNTEEARTLAQEATTYVKENEQERVDVVKQATAAEAEAVFRTMFMDLIGQGMPTDAATALVEAIATEAGKRQIFVPVQAELEASFDDEGKIKDVGDFISKNLTPSIENLNGKLKDLGKSGFKDAFDQSAIDSAKRGLSVLGDWAPNANQKKSILATASALELVKKNSQTAMSMLSAQFMNGEVSVKQFNQGMSQVQQTLSALPNNQGLQITKDQLSAIYPEFEPIIGKINDSELAFKLLKAEAMGVDMSGFIQNMANAGNSAETAASQVAYLNSVIASAGKVVTLDKQIADIQSKLDAEMAKPVDKKDEKKDTSGAGATKDPFADREDDIRDEQAQITIDEIKMDRNAEKQFLKDFQEKFSSTKIEFDGMSIPVESFEDVEYAIDMIGESVEDVEKKIAAEEEAIKNINSEIEIYQTEMDNINHIIDLQGQEIEIIEKQYQNILEPLETQRQLHQDNLDALEEQRDAALRPIEDTIYALERKMDLEQEIADQQNEALDTQEKAIDDQVDGLDEQVRKINDQKEALDKVAKVNQFLIDQNKRQISLAQALSSGDVYAAAQAAEEIRAAQIENSSELQKSAFDEEQKNIEDKKDALQDEKDAINLQRDAIQARLDLIQKEIDAEEEKKYLIEDSYRLRLRVEEDAINASDKAIDSYERERDAKIKPFQEIIDNYGPRLTALNNAIYDKEVEIRDIERERIKPLEDQATELQKQVDLLEDFKTDAERQIERDRSALARRKEYLDQELQILGARREIADLESGGGGGGGETKGTRDEELIKDLEARLAALRDKKGVEEKNRPVAAKPVEGPSMVQNIIGDIKSNPIIRAVAAIGVAIGTILGKAIKGVWDKIVEVLSPFGEWFKTNVIDNITKFFGTIATWIDTNVVTPIKGFFGTIADWIDKNVIKRIEALWNSFIEWTKKPFDEMVADVVSFFESLPSKIMSFITETIPGYFNTATETIKTWLGNIVTWFTELPGKIMNFVTVDIPAFFGTMWGTESTGILGWINKIFTWWSNLPSKIMNFITTDIPAFFGTMWGTEDSGIYGWINKIFTFFSGLPTKIKSFITETIPGYFTSMVGTMPGDDGTGGTGVLGVVGGILKFFVDLPSKITGAFSNVATIIGDTIKGVLNSVIDIWNGFKLEIGEFSLGPLGPFGPYDLNLPDLDRFAKGGVVGDGGRDSVPAILTPGEFVIRKPMVDKYGSSMMSKINQGSYDMPSYEMPKTSGSSITSTTNTASINAPVYNTYSINIPVSQTNASADDIANRVMMKIKGIESSSIRRINGY